MQPSSLVCCAIAVLMATAIPLAAAEHGGAPPAPTPDPAPAPSQTIPDSQTNGGYTGEMHPDTPGVSPPTRENDPDVATTPATAPTPVPDQTQTGGGKPAWTKGKN